ncbi:hypothetical protein [Halopseudomonas bauzanensis]|uniref:hypothetical protein n=1 Tax=Halopseudomonas bauzanensis TaxID=653930 RepID=UPI00145D8C6E|nr:hypothetical protein [Halopseudomonas bauzanensis]
MDSNRVTLQTHLDGRWQDAMVIRFDQPEQGLASVCSTEYVLPDLLYIYPKKPGTLR